MCSLLECTYSFYIRSLTEMKVSLYCVMFRQRLEHELVLAAYNVFINRLDKACVIGATLGVKASLVRTFIIVITVSVIVVECCKCLC